MAELVSTAIVQETDSQILSGLVQKYEKEESDVNRNLERLEMAHIRLEAAVEVSDKWRITHASLLRWHRKLKRVAQECDDTLHKCKKRILEDEQMEHEVRNSSIPKRIAHATKSFVSSIFRSDKDESSKSIVRRFEWFAHGASEFVKLVELGGTLHRHMPFHSFTKHRFAGKALQHKIVRGDKYPLFLLWLVPLHTAHHGIEASLIFIQKDSTSSEGDIYFSVILQLSESTDIIGIVIKCLQLFAPRFKCAIENMRKELTQLPAQDLSWVLPPTQDYEHSRDNVQTLWSQWFRPNPFCCKHHDWHEGRHTSRLETDGLLDALLQPVLEVNLQCQVSLYNQKTLLSEDIISLQHYPYLKAGISLAPHRSSEVMLPANRSSAMVAVVGEEQHCLHTDIPLEQLEETCMLPDAIGYFHQNTKATSYKMVWKSKHGSAHIQVEKVSMSTRRTSGRARTRGLLQGKMRRLGHVQSLT
ncbi:unnamed protein product [Urochloa decumbens]|uniref:Rx N-terminal domain-containing protein n=1 Tax=Urochloa decumbens TaxID=240449 RepID=A0ABC9FKY4_9POAL